MSSNGENPHYNVFECNMRLARLWALTDSPSGRCVTRPRFHTALLEPAQQRISTGGDADTRTWHLKSFTAEMCQRTLWGTHSVGWPRRGCRWQRIPQRAPHNDCVTVLCRRIHLSVAILLTSDYLMRRHPGMCPFLLQVRFKCCYMPSNASKHRIAEK
jgi:hypothetical protein